MEIADNVMESIGSTPLVRSDTFADDLVEEIEVQQLREEIRIRKPRIPIST
jgi:hypothetical protein